MLLGNQCHGQLASQLKTRCCQSAHKPVVEKAVRLGGIGLNEHWLHDTSRIYAIIMLNDTPTDMCLLPSQALHLEAAVDGGRNAVDTAPRSRAGRTTLVPPDEGGVLGCALVLSRHVVVEKEAQLAEVHAVLPGTACMQWAGEIFATPSGRGTV